MTEQQANAEPSPASARFTVDYWAAFWGNPDPTLVGRMAAADVVGDWPGDPAPVRGLDAYRSRIRQVLELVPDLRLEVAEHAENGDVSFIRWIARGTGVDGPFELDGIDRIVLEDGLVKSTTRRSRSGRSSSPRNRSCASAPFARSPSKRS